MTVNITLNDATLSSLPEFVRTNNAATTHHDLEAVAQAIARARRIVVVCGAGISVASGIPDFRSSEGLFRTLKEENPKELLTSGKDLFDSSLFSVPERTVLFYKMIAQLASLSSQAQPSLFHRFLKVLDERGQLLRLYTQNIDNLEEKAGLSYGVPSWSTPSKAAPALDLPAAASSSRLAPRCIPLHGTLKRLVCPRCAHAIPLENELETLAGGHSVACPQCTSNGSMRRMEGKRDRGVGRMRPSVVLYGEEHLAGEGVGECVRRDLIGLGDVLSSSAQPSSSSPLAPTPLLKPSVTKTPAPRARASAQPDLLIVAGSSLKVPGTKRIVREFAKAVQSTRSSAASSRSSTPASQAPSPSKARNSTLSSTLKPLSSSDKDDSERTLIDSATPQSHSDTESSHSFYDLAAHPPRTIYLNLDFPAPTRDWKGVFDVWVQGDVQTLVETFMNALEERDKNQSTAVPAENGKAKPRSRKRKSDADGKGQPSSPKKRKVVADSTANSGEEGAPKTGKRKSRSKAKKMDFDDEDASPEMVAARSLLALSVSPSPPSYNSNARRRKHIPVVQLQSHRQTSTAIPPPRIPSPASAPCQHNRSAGVQQEPSPHLDFHAAGYDDHQDGACTARKKTMVDERGDEVCCCHHCKSAKAGIEWPRCPDVSISQALVAKKRARNTAIQIDPALVENGSAALIRTMSLGLRDRGKS